MTTTRNLKVLLVAVILLQFGFPITTYGRGWTGVYLLTHVTMVLFGILTVRDRQYPLAPIATLAAGVLACGAWFSFDPVSTPATMSVNLATGLFMLYLILFLLRFMFGKRHAPAVHLVLGAVIVYLLLGGVFKSAFVALEIMAPGSFVDTTAPDRPVVWQQLLYYSYVTLSTLGYGEVLPVHLWARSLAILETVTGPLFLATVVARLVGAYATPGAPGGSGAVAHRAP